MRRFALSLLPLVAVAAGGCAHTAAEAHQLSEMNETVDKVQSEQDRENRSFMDEGMAVNNPAAPASAQATPAAPPRTVQLDQQPDDGVSDDPNDPTARPVISVSGNGGSGSASTRPRSGKSQRVDSSDPLGPSLGSDTHSSALDPDAKKAYDAAISLVNQKQYDRALDALNGFLTKWPDHPYVENALYWKGECLYAQGEYLRAAEQFEAVVNRFGGGKKGADALLKLGMCQDRLGASDRAHEYWERLRRDYPRSDAAKKIPAYESTRPGAGPKETR